MKTRFQNLFYLEKALNKLKIVHNEKEINSSNFDSDFTTKNLVIPQSNGYDIEFDWNGQEYELVVDLSFWNQPYPIESFMDKVSQQYAKEVILGESQKSGFQAMNSRTNLDGSKTLILERWNTKTKSGNPTF
jgi:hypothetical protein